jgi:hypothetical protein
MMATCGQDVRADRTGGGARVWDALEVSEHYFDNTACSRWQAIARHEQDGLLLDRRGSLLPEFSKLPVEKLALPAEPPNRQRGEHRH